VRTSRNVGAECSSARSSSASNSALPTPLPCQSVTRRWSARWLQDPALCRQRQAPRVGHRVHHIVVGTEVVVPELARTGTPAPPRVVPGKSWRSNSAQRRVSCLRNGDSVNSRTTHPLPPDRFDRVRPSQVQRGQRSGRCACQQLTAAAPTSPSAEDTSWAGPQSEHLGVDLRALATAVRDVAGQSGQLAGRSTCGPSARRPRRRRAAQ